MTESARASMLRVPVDAIPGVRPRVGQHPGVGLVPSESSPIDQDLWEMCEHDALWYVTELRRRGLMMPFDGSTLIDDILYEQARNGVDATMIL
jgi:hypothetical protein